MPSSVPHHVADLVSFWGVPLWPWVWKDTSPRLISRMDTQLHQHWHLSHCTHQSWLSPGAAQQVSRAATHPATVTQALRRARRRCQSLVLLVPMRAAAQPHTPGAAFWEFWAETLCSVSWRAKPMAQAELSSSPCTAFHNCVLGRLSNSLKLNFIL